MTIILHLRSVNKGEFLLLREGVTSPMRANFTHKITKIQELPRARPLGPHQGVAVDPLGALRRPQDPMPLKKKIHPPNQNSWIRPCLAS